MVPIQINKFLKEIGEWKNEHGDGNYGGGDLNYMRIGLEAKNMFFVVPLLLCGVTFSTLLFRFVMCASLMFSNFSSSILL